MTSTQHTPLETELLQTMLAAKQFVENLPENILDKSLMLSHMNSAIAKARGQS